MVLKIKVYLKLFTEKLKIIYNYYYCYKFYDDIDYLMINV